MVHNSILSQNIVVELKILGLRSLTPPNGHPSAEGKKMLIPLYKRGDKF